MLVQVVAQVVAVLAVLAVLVAVVQVVAVATRVMEALHPQFYIAVQWIQPLTVCVTVGLGQEHLQLPEQAQQTQWSATHKPQQFALFTVVGLRKVNCPKPHYLRQHHALSVTQPHAHQYQRE